MAEIGPYFFALGSQTVAPNFFDLGANGSSEFFSTVQRWIDPQYNLGMEFIVTFQRDVGFWKF